jgi:protease I
MNQTSQQNASQQNSGEKDIYAVAPTPDRLKKNARIAILTGDQTEDLEFFYPYYRLTEEGYTVDVLTVDGGSFQGKHGLGLKQTQSVRDAKAEDYALLYLPGGKAPEMLREQEEVLEFVRQFCQSGKPVAAVCHGPQILITAGVVEGKRMSGYPGIREELEQAGATFADEALAIDGQFITSRLPGDLHRHLCGVINTLEGKRDGKNQQKSAA